MTEPEGAGTLVFLTGHPAFNRLVTGLRESVLTEVDNSRLTACQAAERMAEHFGLPRAGK